MSALSMTAEDAANYDGAEISRRDHTDGNNCE
jgi:hypothetical protein